MLRGSSRRRPRRHSPIFCLTIYGYVNGIFAVFYGTAAMVRGYLILWAFRRFLPRALGAFFIFGGAGFIAKNILVVAVPGTTCLTYFLPHVPRRRWLLGALAADQGHRSRPMGCETDGTGNC